MFKPRSGSPWGFFERERRVVFVEAEDGLDLYRGALFLKDEVIPVVLKQYRDNNPNEPAIYLSPDHEDLDDITRLIADIVADLELTSTDIAWQRMDSWQG